MDSVSSTTVDLGTSWPVPTEDTFNALLSKHLDQSEHDQPRLAALVLPTPNIPEADKEALLGEAEALIGEPWPFPTGGDLIRFHTEGERTPYEDPVAERQARLTTMVVAALLEDDQRWLDEVVTGVLALCEQSSWCWPAHDDVLTERGWYLPDPQNPYLDLGASEVCVQLAWTHRVLGARLDEAAPGLRERIRLEVDRRCFLPFLERIDWHWLGITTPPHNWCAWIHGNLLTSILALGDTSDQGLEVAWRSLQGLARYSHQLPDDGAIDEGFSYWWNGAGRALEAFDYLSVAVAGELPAVPAVPGLQASVSFPWKMRVGESVYASFSDATAAPHEPLPWDTLWRAAGHISEVRTEAFALENVASNEEPPDPTLGLSRVLRYLMDDDLQRALSSPSTGQTGSSANPTQFASEVWLPSIQFALARQSPTDPTGLTVTLKGGHNDENHNHNDIGTFTLAVDGAALIVDPGRVEYTALTFSERRYEIWAMNSRWHSVPEIAGTLQRAGREHQATKPTFTAGDNQVTAGFNIEGAYEAAQGTWRRTFTMDRQDGSVLLTDTWEDEPGIHILALVARGDVELRGNTALIRGPKGESVAVQCEEGPLKAEALELTDTHMMRGWGHQLTRITCEVMGPSGSHTMKFHQEG